MRGASRKADACYLRPTLGGRTRGDARRLIEHVRGPDASDRLPAQPRAPPRRDVWHAREPEALFTFTVLTTLPNEVSGTVHDRMPLIVQPKDYARWLDPENEDVADLLAPYPAERMVAYAVNRRVNDPKNDDARLSEPDPA